MATRADIDRVLEKAQAEYVTANQSAYCRSMAAFAGPTTNARRMRRQRERQERKRIEAEMQSALASIGVLLIGFWLGWRIRGIVNAIMNIFNAQAGYVE